MICDQNDPCATCRPSARATWSVTPARLGWRDGKRALEQFGAAIAAVSLSACGLPPLGPDPLALTSPPPPRESVIHADIVAALDCIAKSGALRGTRFAIALHADGTGKSAAGFEGATGSFLPQGTSAIWATQAVMLAGGTAQNYYELNTERALRQFGGDELSGTLSQVQTDRAPNLVIATAFTALDFLAGPTVDVRVGNVGPRTLTRGVSIEAAAEIYRPGDRTTLAVSSMNRQVFYREATLGFGRFIGGGAGTPVTGAVGQADQQRLQEAMRDTIALSVADVLVRVPKVPDRCKAQVDALKRPPAPEPPPSTPGTPVAGIIQADAAPVPRRAVN
jgi:hypothetical protein